MPEINDLVILHASFKKSNIYKVVAIAENGNYVIEEVETKELIDATPECLIVYNGY